ncbi:hypothetical protein ACQEVG_18095 [Streptomyces sp. CA-135486]|uniref:hypothetical protein n=1 Tax=Streptomyces sp. CA-135486 TaxID=3240049 RepID=UPI003D90D3CE
MPPVRHLDGLRSPGGGAFGEERRAVTADDFDARPLGQPRGLRRCLPVGQQVDGRRVSMSTRTVPYLRPLRVAYSSTPTSRGAGVSGSGNA